MRDPRQPICGEHDAPPKRKARRPVPPNTTPVDQLVQRASPPVDVSGRSGQSHRDLPHSRRMGSVATRIPGTGPVLTATSSSEQLSKVLTNRLSAMLQMLYAAANWREQGSDGAEYASIATGLVNWEYFQWIVDFQKVRASGGSTKPARTVGSSNRRAGISNAVPATRLKARRHGLPACWGNRSTCRIFQPRYGEPRDEYASDCAVRALNEAIGRDRYGEIWDAINRSIRDLGYALDADQGANWVGHPSDLRKLWVAAHLRRRQDQPSFPSPSHRYERNPRGPRADF